ncbi:hypothetical protein MRX96_000158 [Rhipicephalus microplus]
MAGAASPSPGRPPLQGMLGRPLRIKAPWCLQGMFRLALQVDRTCPGKFHFSASLHLKDGARFMRTDQVPAQRNILAPPTEGAILRAAIAAQPSSQPKHG